MDQSASGFGLLVYTSSLPEDYEHQPALLGLLVMGRAPLYRASTPALTSMSRLLGPDVLDSGTPPPPHTILLKKIGRASCRERV